MTWTYLALGMGMAEAEEDMEDMEDMEADMDELGL